MFRIFEAQRTSVLIMDASGHINVAYNSFAQGLNRPADVTARAPLRASLYQAPIFSRSRYHLRARKEIMANGLFDIDVLSSLTSPDSRERMPEVAGGDSHGINVLVFEYSPQVLLERWLLAGQRLKLGGRKRNPS